MTDRIKFASLEAKTPAQRRREARAEGQAAFHRHEALINPYNPNSPEAKAWEDGYEGR